MAEVPKSPLIPLRKAAECLERATRMDQCAAQAEGGDHISFLALAKSWRRVARMAQYQDNWFTLHA